MARWFVAVVVVAVVCGDAVVGRVSWSSVAHLGGCLSVMAVSCGVVLPSFFVVVVLSHTHSLIHTVQSGQVLAALLM